MKKGKGAKMKAKWQNTEKSKKLGLIFGGAALFAFIAIGGFALLGSNGKESGVPSSKAETSYVLSKTEDFNTLNTADWQTYDKTLYARSQAYYMVANTFVQNGNFVIRTQRHCIDSAIDLSVSSNRSAINSSTASTAPCPAGKQTIYSSGYMTSKFRVPNGKVEVRAKVPVLQKGYWLGLWLRNSDAWCAANYGELDVSEVYGDNPKQTTATSHISCANDSTKKVQHATTLSQLLSDDWHIWSMEWDTTKIVYKMDGTVVSTTSGNADGDPSADTAGDFAAKGMAASQFYAIMNQSWESRLEVQVTKAGDAWHPAPDNAANYAAMDTLIDYIKWYVPGTATTPPPTGDTTAPAVTVTAPAASAVVKGTITTSATATDTVGVTKAELLVNGTLKQTITGAGPFTSTIDTTTLANNSTATITWKAYDAAGNVGTKSITTTVSNTTTTTDTTPPSAPANVVVDPIDVTPGVPIVVKWSASTDNVGVTQYLVTRDGAYEVGTVTTTSFSDTTADKTTCTTYCHTYIIYALDAAGNKSAGSVKAVGVVKDMVAPTAPTALTSPDQTTTSVNLSWGAATDVVGVTGYKVYRNGVQVGTATTTSFSSTGLAANTSYSFTVSAVDAVGNESVKSNVLTVATKPLPDTTAPTAPATATATVNSATKVTLAWSAATDNVGVTKYYVQRDGVTLAQVNAPTLSYVDTTVQPSSQYTYTVKAVDLAGNISASSPVASATTPALADTTAPSSPSTLTVTLVTSSQVNIAWAAATDNVGVAYYKVTRNGAQLANSTTTNFGDATVQPGTQYTYAVTAYDAAGNVSPAATVAVTTSLAVAQGLSGVTATYYSGTALSGTPVLTRNESTINNSWGSSSPSASVPTNKFSARWVGSVTPVSSGQYTFYTTSDDGVRLWVNGQQIINNWTDHGTKENVGTITLTAGVKYDVKMEYYENTGQAVAQLRWSGPGVVKAIVPNSALTTDVSGLTANYYAGTTPSGTPLITRIDGTVNFNWASASPDVKIPADDFSAQWTGKVVIPTTGQYIFFTNADDGARLWVNGQQLVEDWNSHYATENSGVIQLEGGKEYPIRLEYYERGGLSSVQLLWQGPGTSKAIIPVSSLRSQ